jgi:EmrB/QacA subfamily drug resistance transporter
VSTGASTSGWRSLDRRQRGVLACTVTANALVFFDQTAVTVALPAIGRDFGAGTDLLPWVITSYLLALAIFMIIAGRVADHYGRKKTFLAGLVLFGVGSALCAAAPTMELLLAARFVQGMGGAVVAPLALGNTTRAVSDAQRGWAVGVFASGGTTFLVLGPLLAGMLLAVASWRSLFLVNLPVVAFAVVVGWRTVTPSREAVPKPLRWNAVGLLLAGLTAFVVGCVELGTSPGPVPAALLVGGLALLALFVRHEMHAPAPLIELRLLGDRMLASSLAALFAIQFAVFGVTVPLALYLQHGLGLGPLAAGVVLALAGLGSPLLSVWIGRITDRTGPRRLALPGLALATLALLAVALPAPLGSVAVLLPGLLAFAVARPMVFTPANAGPFIALGSERRAFAASLATEARQLGAVLGVALTGMAMAAVHGTELVEGDAGLVDGFQAAVLVAAAVCAVATVAVWRRMPAGRG